MSRTALLRSGSGTTTTMTRTWKQAILDLRLQDGHRVTDGTRTWDVERDGFGRYTLKGVNGTRNIWDDDLARTEAPAELRQVAKTKRPK